MKTSAITFTLHRLVSILPIAALCFTCLGCLSLDPFLFKGDELDNYKLDNYDGETECSNAITFLADSPQPVTSEITITSGSETIYGILCRKDTATLTSADTIILYFHGTGPHIDYYWPRTRLLFALGYPVLVIDYKGYGKSSGEPTEQGIYEDGRAALDYINTQYGYPSVIIYAFSLGSLVGCEVASTDTGSNIIQLVLESPIGSVETLVEDACYLNLPGSYVTTYKGNNSIKIVAVNAPLLWIHGTTDETLNRETNGLPVWQAYRTAHPGQGYYIRVDGAGHRNNPFIIGYDRYLECVKDFIHDESIKDPLLRKD
jgi:pimeloyl-ACP methyl ester carboxylesterase